MATNIPSPTGETFWQKNQVLISGLAGAIALVLQQFLSSTVIDYKAVGLAVLIAVAGFLGNALRGKGVTIAGFIGIVATAITTIQSTGQFTWAQFGFSVVLGFLAMVAPPPKPATYEHNEAIVQAKEVPPVNQVPIPESAKLP